MYTEEYGSLNDLIRDILGMFFYDLWLIKHN